MLLLLWRLYFLAVFWNSSHHLEIYTTLKKMITCPHVLIPKKNQSFFFFFFTRAVVLLMWRLYHVHIFYYTQRTVMSPLTSRAMCGWWRRAWGTEQSGERGGPRRMQLRRFWQSYLRYCPATPTQLTHNYFQLGPSSWRNFTTREG